MGSSFEERKDNKNDFEDYFQIDEWRIVEKGFSPDKNRFAESVMSLGNGHMGIRGNFEEHYSGDSLQGTYIAGVYYPDKTVVGWWKIGYPEYYAKVPNAADFIGIDVEIGGERLDLAQWHLEDFKRILNMQKGVLRREFTAASPEKDNRIEVSVERFLSLARREVAAISYSITPLEKPVDISFSPHIDGNIRNEDANYDEIFWEEVDRGVHSGGGQLTLRTKKSEFNVATAMRSELSGLQVEEGTGIEREPIERKKFIAENIQVSAERGQEINLTKYIGVTTDRDYKKERTAARAEDRVREAASCGYDGLLDEHVGEWQEIWRDNDIKIEGDKKAQQGIRFNIFHLNQTYTGHDPRLNIGPKGFTGERYGGATYWDTEAYCLPFYLNSKDDEIARNLLLYRYHHLDKARENADKLGLDGALYPMVTMNGEECHNEWEITFEEIHRNAAIVYAIYNYIRHTGDRQYLADYGFEVIAAVARFWSDRAHYNPRRDKYMIIGVTGPNEYENNVHNNWYTNRMAVWCLNYAFDVKNYLEKEHPERSEKLLSRLELTEEELERWRDITEKMYLPRWQEREIFEQQDGYRDKKLDKVSDLDAEDLPLNQNWSWDKILRSPYVKQADVLQGLYFLSDQYDRETKKKNFDFYEPRTVHESSLSPCIHAVIAAEIGYPHKAYELYLRTARLDLENVNRDTEDGLHITSMAGTWMAVVEGFAGKKAEGGELSISPMLPESWDSYQFHLNFQNSLLQVSISESGIDVELIGGDPLTLTIYEDQHRITRDSPAEVPLSGGEKRNG
ncbi:family 65 glycosyl hydrolase domain-containing protein [Halarsenatibacter silvermanii]|uniref:Maltose phosphorylase n=1 Tax=Halarsenatibacter silvermanii TaxID=321763 RepID=A0A1G9HZ57_9FIRM|nr:family 65 glycosyl hydrolase domain-containing protein [Halarsenatibacter silvermanii]SDL18132.1 maltose phosphorylase [Halarsenatibacter silvermanii]